MIEIKVNGFTCFCEELEDNTLKLKRYEGGDAILDLSGYNISVIERKAFLSCKTIKSLFLPASIKFLEDWAFSKCTSLKKVQIASDFNPNLFGRGVFEGCNNIESFSFKDSDEDLKILLAATTNKLFNEHLLRSSDIGEKSWYEKWDLYLLSVLKESDSEGSIEASVCGEEDTSYTGMVDGEMPGNENEFEKNAGKNKCFLCFERLLHSSGLEPDVKNKLEEYIKRPLAWITLKEDCDDRIDFFQIYLDVVKPDSEEINRMIADLNNSQVQIKAFLIEKASTKNESDSFFDDLML